jgi:hypothetical protein
MADRPTTHECGYQPPQPAGKVIVRQGVPTCD